MYTVTVVRRDSLVAWIRAARAQCARSYGEVLTRVHSPDIIFKTTFLIESLQSRGYIVREVYSYGAFICCVWWVFFLDIKEILRRKYGIFFCEVVLNLRILISSENGRGKIELRLMCFVTLLFLSVGIALAAVSSRAQITFAKTYRIGIDWALRCSDLNCFVVSLIGLNV